MRFLYLGSEILLKSGRVCSSSRKVGSTNSHRASPRLVHNSSVMSDQVLQPVDLKPHNAKPIEKAPLVWQCSPSSDLKPDKKHLHRISFCPTLNQTCVEKHSARSHLLPMATKILMTSLQVGILPGLRKTSCWFLCEFWQKISPLMVITFVSG